MLFFMGLARHLLWFVNLFSIVNVEKSNLCIFFLFPPQAYKQGMLGDGYVWMLLGYYSKNWHLEDDDELECTKEEMQKAVEKSLYLSVESLHVGPSLGKTTTGIVSYSKLNNNNNDNDKNKTTTTTTTHFAFVERYSKLFNMLIPCKFILRFILLLWIRITPFISPHILKVCLFCDPSKQSDGDVYKNVCRAP